MLRSHRVPFEYKSRYKTRKRDITTNVLGVCERNLIFTYVLLGWEVLVADSGVLRDSIMRRNGLKIPEGIPCIYACIFILKHKKNSVFNFFNKVIVHEKNRKVTKSYVYIIGNEMDVDPLEIDMEEQLENKPAHIDVLESSKE